MYFKNTFIFFIFFSVLSTSAQTVWNGPKITFSKNNYSNWFHSSNQDRITEKIWLTRANSKGLFNIKNESGNFQTCNEDLPSDTEWAYGTTDNYQNLSYSSLAYLLNCKLNSIVNGKNIVLHLISDDIYIDVKFTSWTSGSSGGGFSYIRSTPPVTTSVLKVNSSKVKLYPNPAETQIRFEGLKKRYPFKIYNILGAEMHRGELNENFSIDVHQLEKGTYFVQLGDYAFKKFVKK